jgi:hypothetical protein
MEDWLGGIARALTFYGGVPQLIVPDNPRAMIADPDRYEPHEAMTGMTSGSVSASPLRVLMAYRDGGGTVPP